MSASASAIIVNSIDAYIYDGTNECCICYEGLKTDLSANTCVTTCGHKYCMTCFIKCIQTNNNCAICRNELYVEKNDDDDEETLWSEDDEDEDDEDEEDIEPVEDYGEEGDEQKVSLEMIMDRFQYEGISYKDLLRSIYWYHKSDSEEYTDENSRMKLREKMLRIVSDIYKETEEKEVMEKEDLRSKRLESVVPGIAGMAVEISSRVENILIPRRRVR
jgi:hypothetical protein